jgi:ketosteroid isomerase-like protein
MQVFSISILLVVLWSACSVKRLQQNDITAILQVLKKQELTWNNGDIDLFMEGYWKSDSLVFIGKSGAKYGWETTLNNYKKSYPTPEIMGKLSFEIQKLEMISADMAFIIGKYTLVRKQDQPSGYFTLLWKKIGGQWYIISDHTSG